MYYKGVLVHAPYTNQNFGIYNINIMLDYIIIYIIIMIMLKRSVNNLIILTSIRDLKIPKVLFVWFF